MQPETEDQKATLPAHPFIRQAPSRGRDYDSNISQSTVSPQRDHSMAAAAVRLPPPMSNIPMASENDRPDLPRPYKCPLCDKVRSRGSEREGI
jgi:hypothetical protein